MAQRDSTVFRNETPAESAAIAFARGPRARSFLALWAATHERQRAATQARSARAGWSLATTATLAGVLILVVVRTLAPFPATNDHAYFLPAAFAFSEGGPLANPWMPAGFNTALDWHGFLQPWLIGALARVFGGGWTPVYLANNLVAALTLLGAVYAAMRMRLGPWRTTAIALLTLALMLDSRSRPETLATLEIVALVLAFATPPPDAFASLWRAAATGLIFASLLATHPLLFGLTAVAFTMFAILAWTANPIPLARMALFVAVIAAAFTIGFAALATLCFPGTIADWFIGIRRAAALTVGRMDSEGFLHFYVANRFLPGIGLGLLFLPLGAAAMLRNCGGRFARARALLVCAAALGFAALVWWFAVRVPPTYYNYTGLLAAGALVACSLTRGVAVLRRLCDGVLALLALSSLAGGALWVVQSLQDRPAILATRAALAQAMAGDARRGLRLCADTAALPALDDPTLVRRVSVSIPFGGSPFPPVPAACNVFYELQTRGAEGAPQPVDGFRLQDDHTLPPEWSGARPLHFGFARYVSERG